jgi:hypothetical protein
MTWRQLQSSLLVGKPVYYRIKMLIPTTQGSRSKQSAQNIKYTTTTAAFRVCPGSRVVSTAMELLLLLAHDVDCCWQDAGKTKPLLLGRPLHYVHTHTLLAPLLLQSAYFSHAKYYYDATLRMTLFGLPWRRVHTMWSLDPILLFRTAQGPITANIEHTHTHQDTHQRHRHTAAIARRAHSRTQGLDGSPLLQPLR